MRRRVRLASLGAVVSIAAGAPLPGAGAAPCAGVHTKGTWKTIDLPTANASVHPDPSGPGRFFAADQRVYGAGTQTLRQSTDGGCTWHVVFTASDVTRMLTAEATLYAHDPAYGIEQVVVPDSHEPPARQHVYLLLHDFATNTFTPLAPEVVVASADGGRTWTAHAPALTDLDARGRACTAPGPASSQLVVAPSDPRVVYLLCLQVAWTFSVESTIYNYAGSNPLWNRVTWFATSDGGTTWTVAARVADGDVNTTTDYFYFKLIGPPAVDPQDPKSIWLAVLRNYPKTGGYQYTVNARHSTDGAKTFREAVAFDVPRGFDFATGEGGVIVTHPRRGAPATIVAWGSFTGNGSIPNGSAGWIGYTTDGARSWRQWDTVPTFGGHTVLTGVAVPLVASTTTVYGLVSSNGETPCGLPVQRAFVMDLRTRRAVPRDPPVATPNRLPGQTFALRPGAGAPSRALYTSALAYPDKETCDAANDGNPATEPSTATRVLLAYTGRV